MSTFRRHGSDIQLHHFEDSSSVSIKVINASSHDKEIAIFAAPPHYNPQGLEIRVHPWKLLNLGPGQDHEPVRFVNTFQFGVKERHGPGDTRSRRTYQLAYDRQVWSFHRDHKNKSWVTNDGHLPSDARNGVLVFNQADTAVDIGLYNNNCPLYEYLNVDVQDRVQLDFHPRLYFYAAAAPITDDQLSVAPTWQIAKQVDIAGVRSLTVTLHDSQSKYQRVAFTPSHVHKV